MSTKTITRTSKHEVRICDVCNEETGMNGLTDGTIDVHDQCALKIVKQYLEEES